MAGKVTDTTDNAVGVAEPRLHSEPPGSGFRQQADHRTDASPAPPDRLVYFEAARASLSQWLKLVGRTPWFHDSARLRQGSQRSASALYRQQTAALAIAILCELDRRRPDRSHLRERVRASLIHWQLSMRGDGRPGHRQLLRSPLYVATAGQVVQLLSETAGFQTGMLLRDLERHLQWLTPRPPQTPWVEAAQICAIADGGVLVRDSALLRQARSRLEALLARQNEEGWFPEHGGADVGRLSLTIDALARLYRQNGWEELKEPLGRALGFLTHFAHPDSSVGGCYSSCGTEFISPYGMELLAPTFEEAASLALLCRRRWAAPVPGGHYGCDGDLRAVLGASAVLAAANAAPLPAERYTLPCEMPGQTRFPHAGLTVFSTETYHAAVAGRSGGALKVTWRNGAAGLEDPGVVVVYPHGTRTAAGPNVRGRQHVNGSSVTCGGILQRARPERAGLQHRIKRLGQMIGVGTRESTATSVPGPATTNGHRPNHIDYGRLTRDQYERQITFGEDWIRIRDRVHCRLPCETIVCQSPTPVPVRPFGDGSASRTTRPPIFVEGGRNVEIIRVYRNGELVKEPPV